MFQFSRAAQEALKEEKLSDLTMEILRSNSSFDIAEKLAQLLMENSKVNPIVITQEDMVVLNKIFRVKGFDTDGKRIGRGRPKKDNEDYND